MTTNEEILKDIVRRAKACYIRAQHIYGDSLDASPIDVERIARDLALLLDAHNLLRDCEAAYQVATKV